MKKEKETMETEQSHEVEISSQIESGQNTAANKPSLDSPSKMTEAVASAAPDQEYNATLRNAGPVNAPYNALRAVYAFGEHKADESWNILSMQAFQAGCYKGIACQLYLTVGGGILGAALFPVGLIAIILTGAELFTSDSLFMVTSFLGGKVKYGSVVRNLTFSWIFNFFGCLFWAGILTYFTDQLEDADQVDFAVKFAEKKANQPWHQIFLKGIGANFLIAVAVWQASTAKEVAGKVLAIWFPVVAFVEIGFDHCVANMYFLPIGMWYGADISIVDLLFLVLLPATLGNMIGGGVGMGLAYWYLYDSMASRAQLSSKLQEALLYHPNIGTGTTSGSNVDQED